MCINQQNLEIEKFVFLKPKFSKEKPAPKINKHIVLQKNPEKYTVISSKLAH